jgi:hypothetical protein
MPEDSDNMNDFEKEIELIFNNADLDVADKEFDALLKTHAGKEIDRIFNETNDLDQIQTQVIEAVREYTKYSPLKDSSALQQIETTITKTCKIFAQPKSKSDIQTQEVGASKNQSQQITEESKKNLKTLLKKFAIYEVYKVMNPRRIAGETKKANYEHNLITGGEEKADKYAGRHFSEKEKAEMRADVNKEMASWGKSRGGTLNALDLEVGNPKIAKSEGLEKTRTVDALGLAGGIRKSLEGSVNKQGLDELRALAREAMDKKRAQEARENKGPGKGQGGHGIG